MADAKIVAVGPGELKLAMLPERFTDSARRVSENQHALTGVTGLRQASFDTSRVFVD